MTLAVKVALNPNPNIQLKRRYTPVQPTNLPSFAQCMGLIPTSLQLAQVLTALLPITRRQILDSSKLKEFADNNFKLDENGRKLSKQIENTVGKGEIARYNFSFSHSVFKGLVSQGRQKVSLCRNGLITLHRGTLSFLDLKEKVLL